MKRKNELQHRLQLIKQKELLRIENQRNRDSGNSLDSNDKTVGLNGESFRRENEKEIEEKEESFNSESKSTEDKDSIVSVVTQNEEVVLATGFEKDIDALIQSVKANEHMLQ